MTQLDQQVLASLFLSPHAKQSDPEMLNVMTRIATFIILFAGAGLIAIAGARKREAAYAADPTSLPPLSVPSSILAADATDELSATREASAAEH